MHRLLIALVAAFLTTAWAAVPVKAEHPYCVSSCQDKADRCANECTDKLGGSLSDCQMACARTLFVACVKRCSKDGVIIEDDYEIGPPSPPQEKEAEEEG